MKSELTALRTAVAAKGDALIAALPREPLWQLNLTCCCNRCIDPEVLPLLRKTQPPDMTEQMIAQYFGGVTAVNVDQSEESQYEARVIVTHVLAHLGRIVIQPREAARKMSMRMSYTDTDYLLPYLLETGFLPRLPEPVRADINAYLLDLAHCAVAVKSPHLTSALCALSVFSEAFPAFVETFRTARARRHLRFWTSIAGSSVSNDRVGAHSDDFHQCFRGMQRSDRDYLSAALEAPQVERLIERCAFQASDPLWLQYLSNLLDWREKAILATRFSERKDGRE